MKKDKICWYARSVLLQMSQQKETVIYKLRAYS